MINGKNKSYFVTKDEVCFKTMSPIIVTDKDKKPLLHPEVKGSID
jgi:hypothetical protein